MAAPTYKHGQFCWNELGTTDETIASEFYSSLLGWTITGKPMPGDMGTYYMCQTNGEDAAGMFKLAGPMFEGVPSHWMAYVWVDDVDASAAKIKELGGEVLFEPMDVPEVGRMAAAKDPTGASFAIFKGTDHPGACQPQDNQAAFCWNECMTRDPEKATAFYTALFGWTANKQQMGPINYTMMMAHGAMAAGLMEMPPEVPAEAPAYWMSYIAVDDVDSRVASIEKMGGRVLQPPTDVPNVGRFCTFSDPTGAEISIIKLNAPTEG